MINPTVRALVPTYFYLSVRYMDGLKDQAARDSYTGVALSIEYNDGVYAAPSAKPEQKMVFFSGDFGQDYNDVVDFVQTINVNEAPFMCSSSFDDYLFDAGYDAVEPVADEIPVATEADLEADQAASQAEWLAYSTPSAASVARFTAVTDRALEIDRKLEAAWAKVPAAKLRWALANVIASSDYNTSYPGAPLGRAEAMDAITVLNALLADQAEAEALRP